MRAAINSHFARARERTVLWNFVAINARDGSSEFASSRTIGIAVERDRANFCFIPSPRRTSVPITSAGRVKTRDGQAGLRGKYSKCEKSAENER
jgi:hypothetical protein